MNRTPCYERGDGGLIPSSGTIHKGKVTMKMTKVLTMTWIPSSDVPESQSANQERWIKLIEMCLDGKLESVHKIKLLDKHTSQRQWRDQEAVDEWIEFLHYLAKKYNGTVVIGEVKDI